MPKFRSRSQRGGRVSMPSAYYNPGDNTHYYPTGSSELTSHGNNAYGPHHAVSYGAPGPSSNFTGPNYAGYSPQHPHSTALQTGGSHPYDRIVNPETGRRVSIYTKKGREVLRNYAAAQ